MGAKIPEHIDPDRRTREFADYRKKIHKVVLLSDDVDTEVYG